MKFCKTFSVLALTVLLTACGHGFEGEYEAQTGSSNPYLNQMAGMVSGGQKERIIIGGDYLEANGQRTELDEIFVRESGDKRYLVFKDGESEEAWSIIDDKTLTQGNELVNVTLVRID